DQELLATSSAPRHADAPIESSAVVQGHDHGNLHAHVEPCRHTSLEMQHVGVARELAHLALQRRTREVAEWPRQMAEAATEPGWWMHGDPLDAQLDGFR